MSGLDKMQREALFREFLDYQKNQKQSLFADFQSYVKAHSSAGDNSSSKTTGAAAAGNMP